VEPSLVRIARDLARRAARLRFGAPVAHVYNPLDYAWAAHRLYLERYGRGTREVLLLGMNPGPWGMAQTGIPFGDVDLVRGWLGIEAEVERPPREHPKRPVEGFLCRRREVSGQRLWGWARETFGSPERFFARFLVLNYCPLAFLEATGRNRTPDKLPARESGPLLDACDDALREVVAALRPRVVMGIGRFAEARARAVAGDGVAIGYLPHPSPASPQANRDWSRLAAAAIREAGIEVPGRRGPRTPSL
jgi:single-strand selective monofunctional uracil DNA glycosylase